ncbi:MAG: hypothetical protein VKO65_08020 [Cyanobacteriota bacterium]|nr:hypothetical protein [Cyanobacteriota bacterium]
MLRPFCGEAITRTSGVALIASSVVACVVSAGPAQALLILNLFEPAQPAPTSQAAAGSSSASRSRPAPACRSTDPGCEQPLSFDGYFCTGIAGAEGDFYGLSIAPPPVANQEIDLLFRSISPLFETIKRQLLRGPDEYIVLGRDCLTRGSINAILPAAPYAFQRKVESPADPLTSWLAGAWSLTID